MTSWGRRIAAVGLGLVVCLVVLVGDLGAKMPALAGVTINGSVVDPSLNPIAGAAITLERDGKTVATTTTGADGKFRFDSVASGTYHVRVEAKGWPAFARDVRVTDVPAIV